MKFATATVSSCNYVSNKAQDFLFVQHLNKNNYIFISLFGADYFYSK